MTAMPNVIAFHPPPLNAPLRRPRLLIRAARAGQAGWRRERDLPRLLRTDACPHPGAALPRLRADEARMNAERLEGAAEYNLQRHVMLMIAILAEMRAAVANAPQPVMSPNILGATNAKPRFAPLMAARDAISVREKANPVHL